MVAKMREQGRVITFAGKTMCLSEWARDLKLSRAALQWRLEKGWALDKALRPRTSRSGPQNNVYRQVIV